MADVTQILQAIERGDRQATEQLLPAVYEDLRRLAAKRLAQENPGQTLQATALVHEAYMRVVGSNDEPEWDHRGHFFEAAAEAMRRILVDKARKKKCLKRGGDLQRSELQEADLVISIPSDQLLDLDAALDALALESPREAELVKLRYFAGLSSQEAAAVLGISRATAARYWSYARAFLFEQISGEHKSS
jgi:RNA polymerase sigma factor (TIGR02999 family)